MLCRTAADEEYMEIDLMAIDGKKLTFKVKETSKIGKAGLIFCDKFDLDMCAYRMMFDGCALSPEQTFGFYDLQHGDRIDMITYMVGC